MDYSTLKLNGTQIRLITIEPVAHGDQQDRPVRCRMEVRNEGLPTSATITNGGSTPANYIPFDHYVQKLPRESFAFPEDIRQDMLEIEEKLAKKQGLVSKLAWKAASKLRSNSSESSSKFTRDGIEMCVDDIPTLLSKKEIISMLSSGTDVHIKRREGKAKRWGKLPVKDMNPFFKTPKPVPPIDPNNYVALSYAWGPEEPTETIIVNDQPVEARSNLVAALEQFRTMDYFKEGGKIWIDALCIDQNNDSEKEVQIGMMGLIYNLAGNIIVWLGPENDQSNIVIDYLEKWSTYNRVEFVEMWDSSDPLAATSWRIMAQIQLQASCQRFVKLVFEDYGGLSDMEALWMYQFFDRPYWHRLWIIQELMMGRAGMPIVCGSRITQWRYVRDAILLHVPVFDRIYQGAQTELARRGKGTALGFPLQHVAQIAQLEIRGHRRNLPYVDKEDLPIYAPELIRDGPLNGSSIRQVLLLAARALCFKAHDRVYGMLNIPDLPRFGLKADCSKEPGEVFFEFSATCVANGSLDFLALLNGLDMITGGQCSQISESLHRPLWVPDYAGTADTRIGLIEGQWQAGGRTAGEFPDFWGAMGSCSPPKVEGRTLICSAAIVDTIDGVSAVSRIDKVNSPLGSCDYALTSMKQSTVATNSSLGEDVLHKVLIGGCDLAGNKGLVDDASKFLYTAFSSKSVI